MTAFTRRSTITLLVVTSVLVGVGAWAVQKGDDKAVSLSVEVTTVDLPVQEPSGVAYDPDRKSLFVVGDEGDLVELSTDLKLLHRYEIQGDLEGVSHLPAHAGPFVASEGENAVLEYDLASQRINSRHLVDFSSSTDFENKKQGNKGLEGICFVPRPDGSARLFGVMEAKPARLIELEYKSADSKATSKPAVLGPPQEKTEHLKILHSRDLGIKRLSDVSYSQELNCLLVASASEKIALVLDLNGREQLRFRLPGRQPEGLAFLPTGDLIVVQDSGGANIMKNARQAIQRLLDQPAPTSLN